MGNGSITPALYSYYPQNRRGLAYASRCYHILLHGYMDTNMSIEGNDEIKLENCELNASPSQQIWGFHDTSVLVFFVEFLIPFYHTCTWCYNCIVLTRGRSETFPWRSFYLGKTDCKTISCKKNQKIPRRNSKRTLQNKLKRNMTGTKYSVKQSV